MPILARRPHPRSLSRKERGEALLEPLLAGAVHHQPAMLAAELLEGHVERHAGRAGEAFQHRRGTAGCRARATAPRRPSASVSFGSRSRAAGFVPVCTPSPSQAGHQPSGLLKEKWCGASGSKLRPHRSQAKCWLWICDRPARLGHVVAGDRPRASTPRPRARAFSTLPAMRERASGRTVTRSTTTSTRCFRRRSISGGLSSGIGLAVDADPDVAGRADLLPKRLVALAHLDLQRGHQVELRARPDAP